MYTLGILILIAVVTAKRSRSTEEIRKQKLIRGEGAYLNPGQLALWLEAEVLDLMTSRVPL